MKKGDEKLAEFEEGVYALAKNRPWPAYAGSMLKVTNYCMLNITLA